MKQQTPLRTLILVIWAMGTSVLAIDEIDFDQIDKELSSEVKSQVKDYEGMRMLAAEGDKSAQLSMAHGLRELSPETAMLITRHLIDKHDVIVETTSELDLYLLSRLLDDLTKIYINPEHAWFNPEQAFFLSTQFDLKEGQILSITWSLMHNATWLPEVDHLMDAWRLESDNDQRFTDFDGWLASSAEFEDDLGETEMNTSREGYEACPNAFGDTQTVLDQHQHLQAKFLEDGMVDEVELAKYKQAMDAIEVHKQNVPVSFNFKQISLNALFSLMGDALQVSTLR